MSDAQRAAADAILALNPDEAGAVCFVMELMRRNGVCDETYAEAMSCFSEGGIVELLALVGYFVMVCWIMNVARTSGPSASKTPPLRPFPA